MLRQRPAVSLVSFHQEIKIKGILMRRASACLVAMLLVAGPLHTASAQTTTAPAAAPAPAAATVTALIRRILIPGSLLLGTQPASGLPRCDANWGRAEEQRVHRVGPGPRARAATRSGRHGSGIGGCAAGPVSSAGAANRSRGKWESPCTFPSGRGLLLGVGQSRVIKAWQSPQSSSTTFS